jgi:hypothetical protein
MGKWIIGFLGLAIAGVALAILAPQFAATGILISVLASVALLQTVLTAVVLRIASPIAVPSTEPKEERQGSDFARAFFAYHDFKWFLGRLVGIVGLVYGIITNSLYFALLGATATALFWILDRRLEWWVEAVKSRAEFPQEHEDAT